jgi:arsenite methyltransferase
MKASCCVDFYQSPLTQQLLGNSFHPGGVKLTHKLAVSTLVNRNSTVLDVAAGQCASAHYLADNFGATVYALDLGLDNLKGAKIKSGEDKRNKVHFVQADAEHLPIASNSIDVVFCECVLCTFDNRENALTEIYRVLKPRGFIAISDVFLNEQLPIELNTELNRWLCVAGAYNAIRSQEVISQGGFTQVRFRDASSQLLETIHTIESKFAAPGPQLQAMIQQQAQQQQNNWQHDIPRQLAHFIYDGSAGYYTLTARKPG